MPHKAFLTDPFPDGLEVDEVPLDFYRIYFGCMPLFAMCAFMSRNQMLILLDCTVQVILTFSIFPCSSEEVSFSP